MLSLHLNVRPYSNIACCRNFISFSGSCADHEEYSLQHCQMLYPILKEVGHMSIKKCFQTVWSSLAGSQAFLLLWTCLVRLPNKVKSFFFVLYWCKMEEKNQLEWRKFPLLVLASASVEMEKSNSIHISLICTMYFLLNIIFLSNRVADCRSALLTF